MGAGFGNYPLIEYDNFIGVFYGAEAVSDDDNGFIFYQRTDGMLNERFVFRVEGGSCFVQENDRRVL